MRFGLSQKQIELISAQLKNAAVSKAVIFGSRSIGNYRSNSDVDIAVWGCELNIGSILTKLDELPMPYKFDVVDYEKINTAAFREHIDRVGITFFNVDDG